METKGYDMDLDGIIQILDGKGKGFIIQEKIYLLKNVIIKFKAHKSLGIMTRYVKENKRKLGETGNKYGCKYKRARVTKVGVKLVGSSKYPTIRAPLGI